MAVSEHSFNQLFLQIYESAATHPKAFRHGNFFRGCKWSPDGSCVLTSSNDSVCRLYNLPNRYIQAEEESPVDPLLPAVLEPALNVKNNDLVYDFTWYPLMNSTDPDSSVFLVSCGRSPLRLVDAYTGETRAVYKSFVMEQLMSYHSVCFSPDGSLIIGGSHASLWLFNVQSSGSSNDQVLTRQENIKQTGIISSITFNERESDTFATGSFSGSIAIWDLNTFEIVALFDLSKKGVTHMKFTQDGNYLVSGSRSDNSISVWDLRQRKKLTDLTRDSKTNQRMYFDLNDDVLVSGNCNGNFTFWNIKDKVFNDFPTHIEGHNDCVNGISIHPTLPVLSSCSGSRKFPPIEESDDCDELFSSRVPEVDNSLRIWDMAFVNADSEIDKNE